MPQKNKKEEEEKFRKLCKDILYERTMTGTHIGIKVMCQMILDRIKAEGYYDNPKANYKKIVGDIAGMCELHLKNSTEEIAKSANQAKEKGEKYGRKN